MGISKTERDLILLISNALFSATNTNLVDCEWWAIIEEAERQAVLLLLASSELIPMAYRQSIKHKASARIANNMRVDYNHAELHELLTSSNVPYVVLKGCSSASYYPEPTLRTMGDVDFLISPNDVERTGDILKSEGFTPWLLPVAWLYRIARTVVQGETKNRMKLILDSFVDRDKD